MPAHAFPLGSDSRSTLRALDNSDRPTPAHAAAPHAAGVEAEPNERRARPAAGRTCPVALVLRAKRGNRQAFDDLWVRYAPTVHAILLSMVPDTDAEDLLQEVAVAALSSIRTLKNASSFPSWLCAIARNAGRNVLAVRRQRRSLPLAEAECVEAPPTGDPIEADEILAQLRTLPECYREPLILRLMLQMSGAEIAAQTGLTEGSVRVNLCRGMKLLRQRLHNWESEP